MRASFSLLPIVYLINASPPSTPGLRRSTSAYQPSINPGVDGLRPFPCFETHTLQITMEQFVQTIDSTTTLEEYSHAIDTALGENAFLRIWDMNIGPGISRYVRPFKAREYLFGNSALAFQMIARNAGVVFYVPFRVYYTKIHQVIHASPMISRHRFYGSFMMRRFSRSQRPLMSR
jgi:hypothetical protein